MPSAPTPFHVLRAHSSPLSALSVNPSNTILYSGDQDGFVGITDLSSRRVVKYWQAHTGGILSVAEWNGHLISHGRDNRILFHEPLKLSGRLRSDQERNTGLKVLKELDVNALNFCRFAIASTPPTLGGKGKDKEQEGILVIPSLLDSEYADVYHLPSFKRLHSSFNYVPTIKTPGASSSRTGLIMSLHCSLSPSTSGGDGYSMKVAAGYEDGRVELWGLPEGHSWASPTDARTGQSVWEKLYDGKKHNEAIMAMTTNSDLTKAWTVSADHQLVSYDLTTTLSPTGSEAASMKAWSTGQIGHASIALSPNEQVLATGGWDGRIRLFSSTSGKPLGELSYHRESVHILSFAHASPVDGLDGTGTATEVESTIEIGEEDSDSGEEDGSVPPRERWLVSGGKDRRVALWGLMDFSRK